MACIDLAQYCGSKSVCQKSPMAYVLSSSKFESLKDSLQEMFKRPVQDSELMLELEAFAGDRCCLSCMMAYCDGLLTEPEKAKLALISKDCSCDLQAVSVKNILQ